MNNPKDAARRWRQSPKGEAYRKRQGAKIRQMRSILGHAARATGCEECGWQGDSVALDWHHKEPALKKFGIAQHGARSWPLVFEEICKCDVLCARCHRLVHKEDLHSGFSPKPARRA